MMDRGQWKYVKMLLIFLAGMAVMYGWLAANSQIVALL